MLMRGTEVRMLASTRWPLAKPGTSSNITRRIAHLALIDVDDAADLLLRLGALDDLQLAGRRDVVDPVAQILVRHVVLLAAGRSGADSAPKLLIFEHDLVRKVCKFSGSCSNRWRRRPTCRRRPYRRCRRDRGCAACVRRACARSRWTMAPAASFSPRCSSIIAPDQIMPDRVGDALAGDVGRRAVHGLEHRREICVRD